MNPTILQAGKLRPTNTVPCSRSHSNRGCNKNHITSHHCKVLDFLPSHSSLHLNHMPCGLNYDTQDIDKEISDEAVLLKIDI